MWNVCAKFLKAETSPSGFLVKKFTRKSWFFWWIFRWFFSCSFFQGKRPEKIHQKIHRGSQTLKSTNRFREGAFLRNSSVLLQYLGGPFLENCSATFLYIFAEDPHLVGRFRKQDIKKQRERRAKLRAKEGRKKKEEETWKHEKPPPCWWGGFLGQL